MVGLFPHVRFVILDPQDFWSGCLAGQCHPGEFIYRDHQVSAFRDINPIAPTHILIVPNRHIADINDLDAKDEPLIGHLFTVAKQLAEEMGIDQSGYRLIINNGPDAGQVVFHFFYLFR